MKGVATNLLIQGMVQRPWFLVSICCRLLGGCLFMCYVFLSSNIGCPTAHEPFPKTVAAVHLFRRQTRKLIAASLNRFFVFQAILSYCVISFCRAGQREQTKPEQFRRVCFWVIETRNSFLTSNRLLRAEFLYQDSRQAFDSKRWPSWNPLKPIRFLVDTSHAAEVDIQYSHSFARSNTTLMSGFVRACLLSYSCKSKAALIQCACVYIYIYR